LKISYATLKSYIMNLDVDVEKLLKKTEATETDTLW